MSQLHKPFFSIVIPTKDRASLLEDLLISILDQEFKDYEIIISDNSDDCETADALKKYSDKRIVYLKTGNFKMADNWNAGIEECSGEYLLIFSDKMVLKKGAFAYLHNFIKNKNPECVMWNIDAFYDKGKTFQKTPNVVNNLGNDFILADTLISSIISTDFDAYQMPCHCNSAISMKLIDKIIAKSGKACFQLNPDYTLAYQISLQAEKISLLPEDLTILRYPDQLGGYGNGTSFMQKGEVGKQFMIDNQDWSNRTDVYQDVPIKGNRFGFDIILKDLYQILEKYEVDPDTIMSRDERLAHYYFFVYREIQLRINMRIDMSEEMVLWDESLALEPLALKNIVYLRISKERLLLKTQLIKIKIFIKSFSFFRYILSSIGDKIFRPRIIKYNSLNHCLQNTQIF